MSVVFSDKQWATTNDLMTKRVRCAVKEHNFTSTYKFQCRATAYLASSPHFDDVRSPPALVALLPCSLQASCL